MAVKTSPFENVSELLARFQRAVAENRAGQPVLNRTAFVKLVKEIFIDQGTIAAPSYADLDAAFTLADEDKSSGLDEVEFVKVTTYSLHLLMMDIHSMTTLLRF